MLFGRVMIVAAQLLPFDDRERGIERVEFRDVTIRTSDSKAPARKLASGP